MDAGLHVTAKPMKCQTVGDDGMIERERRIANLEAALQSVFEHWEPTRDDYTQDQKGERQFAQARDVWESAHRVLDGN